MSIRGTIIEKMIVGISKHPGFKAQFQKPRHLCQKEFTMKHSATIMAIGAGAVLASLILPAAASAASADLSSAGGSVDRPIGSPSGPRLDGLVINDTPYLLKLEPNGNYSGNVVQPPSNTIGHGPSAHGIFDIQSRVLSAVEADFHYKIEGTDYKVELHNYVPTAGRHEIECSIVDTVNHAAPKAPFTCTATERNTGMESWWNPAPQFTLHPH